jgi:syntaxin 16
MHSPLPGAASPIPNPLIDPSMLESETDRSFSQSAIQQATQKRLYNENDTVIAQREREIEDIAQGIIELANIFQDLQTMVIDQGSMLDRIDYNVEKMATEMKAADKELTVATGYQRRSLKRKIMLLLILIIAGMFILLGLKISSRRSTPPPPPASPPPPATGDVHTTRIVKIRNLAEMRSGLEGSSQPMRFRRDWRRRRKRRSLDELPLLAIG